MLPEAIAARYDLRQLDSNASCIAAVDLSGRITWANRRWFEFGAENGARPGSIAVGVDYFEPAEPNGRRELLTLLDESRRVGKPFDFDYECSSAWQWRLFRLHGLPFAAGALMVHSLRVVRPHEHPVREPDLSLYVTGDQLVVMCANCRRTSRADKTGWDWVPTWVTHPPPEVSHGICEICVGYHWKRIASTRALVVEGQPSLRLELADRLRRVGCTPSLSENAAQARLQLEQGVFDILVVDAGVREAMELCRWTLRYLPAVHCVLLGDVRPASLEPGIEWVPKPVTDEALRGALPLVLHSGGRA